MLNARLCTCRLLTAKYRSARAASDQPAFIGNYLIISHTCLRVHLVDELVLVLCILMIGLMVVLLTSLAGGEYGFSVAGVGVILGNGCGIQGQNYVTIFQGNEMTAEFHYRSWILCI